MDETTHAILNTLEHTQPWAWPADTRLELVGLLRNGSAEVRQRVLELVEPAIDDGLAAEIARVAEDEVEAVAIRRLAVRTLVATLEVCGARAEEILGEHAVAEPPLSTRSYEDVLERLRRLFEDPEQPDSLRREILDATARSRLEWHYTAVEAAWASPDIRWRRAAVRAMRWLFDFDQEILRAVTDSDPEVAAAGLDAAREQWLEAARASAHELAADETVTDYVRLAAIRALGRIGNSESQELMRRLLDHPDPDLSDTAEHALGEYELYSTIDDDEWPIEASDSEWDLL